MLAGAQLFLRLIHSLLLRNPIPASLRAPPGQDRWRAIPTKNCVNLGPIPPEADTTRRGTPKSKLRAEDAVMRTPRRRCSLLGVLAAVCPCVIVLTCVIWILVQGDESDAPHRPARRVSGPNCAPHRAYACVATSYYAALGCYTVAKSLILSKTSCPIYVLSTEDVSSRTISWIESELGAQVRTRTVRWPRGRRPFDPQIAIIGVWEVMREYQKVVLLGHDTIVLRRLDELFEKEELSATQDMYSDMLSLSSFSAGLLVLSPSVETHQRLNAKLSDQKLIALSLRALLSAIFPGWKRLATSWLSPAYMLAAPGLDIATAWRFVHAIQYTGDIRPWESSIGPKETADKAMQALYRLWWRIYYHNIAEPIDISLESVFSEPTTWWDRLSHLALFLVFSTALLWAIILWSGCHSGNYALKARSPKTDV